MLFTHTDWPACMWLKYYLPLCREAKWLPISLWWRGKVWLKHSKVTTKFANWFHCISGGDPKAWGNGGKLVSYIILPFIAFFQLNVHLTLHLCILAQQKDNSFGVCLIMKKKSRFLCPICHLHVDLCFIVKS